ncbi:MAG: sialidase family protein [bacterium]
MLHIEMGELMFRLLLLAFILIPMVAVGSSLSQVSTENISTKNARLHKACQQLPFATSAWVINLNDGKLAAVDNEGIQISSDDGKTWSEPRQIKMPDGTVPQRWEHGTIMLQTKSGVLIMLYMEQGSSFYEWNNELGKPDPRCKLDVWACRSMDGGKTWTDFNRILDGYNGQIIDIKQLSTGRVATLIQDMYMDLGRHYLFGCVSDDEGKTWKRGSNIDIGGHGDHDGALEPTLVELTDGQVMTLIRTNLDEFWSAYSDTHGLYWRVIKPSGIDASSAPGYLLRLASGRIALIWIRVGLEKTPNIQRIPVCQMTETPFSWNRAELSIMFSSDDGKTWSKPVVAAAALEGEMAYAYMLERKSGEIWIIVRCPHGDPVSFKLYEKDFVRNGKYKRYKTTHGSDHYTK